jgi:hypothetical protein
MFISNGGAEFGWRIYGEAERHGLRQAAQVIVIGDGRLGCGAWLGNTFPKPSS